MNLVFKASAVLLALSGLGGQTWLHDTASASQLESAARIAKSCPALKSHAASAAETATQYQMVRIWDAYFRAKITNALYTAAGESHDSCAAD